jgi:hypothetical protein
VSFFEIPEPPPAPKRRRRRKRREEHYLSPTLIVPGYLPGFVLATSDEQAVVVGQIKCYPSGFGFELESVSRYEIEPDDDPRLWAMDLYPHRRREVTPAMLRFGIEYSNGKKATTLDLPDSKTPFDRRGDDSGPQLAQGGGGGGGGYWSQKFWVWPLPPEGPVTFACEWPAFGIEETLRRIDGARFRRAASKAEPLFRP